MLTPFSEELKNLYSLISALDRVTRGREYFNAEEVQRIEYACAGIALRAIDLADLYGSAGETTAEKFLNKDFSYKLESLSATAMQNREWIEEEIGFQSPVLKDHLQVMNGIQSLIRDEWTDLVPEEEKAEVCEYLTAVSRQPMTDAQCEALIAAEVPRGEDDCEKLRKEIKALKERLAALVLERDNLQYVECPRLRALYNLHIAQLESELQHAETVMRYEKRRFEKIRAAVNRQKVPDVVQIDADLRKQFEQYESEFDKLIRKIRKMAEEAMMDRARQAESEEPEDGENPQEDIKAIYRRIVKAMHPDLHPNQTEQEKELFRKAVAAYADGDLETLLMIEKMILGDIPAEDTEIALRKLKEERNRLRELIRDILEEIREIKENFPYTMMKDLTDGKRLEALKNRFRNKTAKVNEAAEAYRKQTEEILGKYGKQ